MVLHARVPRAWATTLGSSRSLRLAHLCLRIHRHEVAAVIADGCMGQGHGHPFGVHCARVLAHMAHLRRVPAVGLQVGREVNHCLVIAPLGGEQQPLGVEVVLDGEVARPVRPGWCRRCPRFAPCSYHQARARST